MKHALLATALIALSGGLTPAHSEEETIDVRIGDEVDRICFGRNINGWKTVANEDGVLLLERGVNDWYRVELIGPCDYRVLQRAFSIGIDSWPAGGCVRRGDRIVVEDRPAFSRRCAISKINKWDDDLAAPDNDVEDNSSDAIEE